MYCKTVNVIVQSKSFYHVYDMPDFVKDKILLEANRQLQAAQLADYKIEWLVSEERAVEQLKQLFSEYNIDISVKFFPE